MDTYSEAVSQKKTRAAETCTGLIVMILTTGTRGATHPQVRPSVRPSS